MQKKTEETKKDTLTLEGEIMDVLPAGLEYIVKVEFKGMTHDLKCYVSGKMRTHYIQLMKGDRVRVEVSIYDITKGRITYRLTQRRPTSGPPRRPKK